MDAAQVELSWHAPASACATEADFRKALEERLGYDPVHPGSTRRLSVRLVQRSDGLFEAVVTEHDAVRAFQGACQDVVDDAALATAMALDPLRAHAPPPKPAAVTVAVEPKSPLAPPPPRRTLRTGPRLELGASTSLAFGHVPDPSLRFGVEAALGWSRLRIAVQGDAGVASTLEASVLGRSIAVDVQPLRAALHVDYSIVQHGRLAFGPLAGASVERLAVRGRGSDRDASTSVVVPRVSLGLRATWRLTGAGDELQRGLRLVFDGVGSVAPGSTTLVVRRAQEQLELWSVPILGAMARVGVSWRF